MAFQFILNGLIVGSLYALVALGFSLIYHTTHVFHIAHGAIYTAGAYLLYLFYSLLGLPFFPSLALALLCTVGLGILVDRWVYAPVLKTRPNPLIAFISSLGVYIIVVNLIALLFGNDTKILMPSVEPTFSFASLIVTRVQMVQLLISLLVIVGVFLLLWTSKLGYIIRGLADNQELMSILGLKVNTVRCAVVGLGSGLAGLAAILVALDVGIDPYVGMEILLVAAVATIIGGVGSYHGATLGAVLLGIVQNLVIWQTSARWQSAVTFLILLLVLLLKPQGLLSGKTRVEEI